MAEVLYYYMERLICLMIEDEWLILSQSSPLIFHFPLELTLMIRNDTNKEEQLDDHVERYLYKVDYCV